MQPHSPSTAPNPVLTMPSAVQDYVGTRPPGVTINGDHLVLPIASLIAMEPGWQAQFAQLLHHYHQRFAGAPWPVYRVVPTRHAKLTELDEQGLAEVGVIMEIGDDAQAEYSDLRTGERIENPEQYVLVSCPDPLTQRRA